MRLRERDEPLDPQVERELEAIDRALAGRPVDPDLQELAELAALVAGERPEPAPEWSAELDERAAARFRGAGSSRSPIEALGRFRPMQILAPAGALATAAVIAIVGVSTLSEPEPTVTSELQSLPSAETQVDQTTPDATSGDAAAESSAFKALEEGSESGGYADDSALAAPSSEDSYSYRSSRDAGEIAPGTEKRGVERDVALVLGTRPENVREVSDSAISITRSLNGIVASSQVSEAGNDATATLQLTIPSRNLDTAIDRLTELANVKSLAEASDDITKPFVSAQDTLRDAEAERRALIEALSNAETVAEADALRLQIADARREISRAESAFENIARRARLSDLSLTIKGDPNIDEDRSIGDWFDDAGSVLRDVAGVLLITAAIVVPLGILFAIGWLIVSRLRRRRRERALDHTT